MRYGCCGQWSLINTRYSGGQGTSTNQYSRRHQYLWDHAPVSLLSATAAAAARAPGLMYSWMRRRADDGGMTTVTVGTTLCVVSEIASRCLTIHHNGRQAAIYDDDRHSCLLLLKWLPAFYFRSPFVLWLGGEVVTASDLWSRGREFDCRLFHCRVALA